MGDSEISPLRHPTHHAIEELGSRRDTYLFSIPIWGQATVDEARLEPEHVEYLALFHICREAGNEQCFLC